VNTLNNMKRQIVALMAVAVLAAMMTVPSFAQAAPATDAEADRIGTAAAVHRLETIRLAVIEEETADGELRYAPVDGSSLPILRYPMSYYTCYFEGIQIPCSLLYWLWD